MAARAHRLRVEDGKRNTLHTRYIATQKGNTYNKYSRLFGCTTMTTHCEKTGQNPTSSLPPGKKGFSDTQFLSSNLEGKTATTEKRSWFFYIFHQHNSCS